MLSRQHKCPYKIVFHSIVRLKHSTWVETSVADFPVLLLHDNKQFNHMQQPTQHNGTTVTADIALLSSATCWWH